MATIDKFDIIALGGLILLTIGVFFVYEPLALIVPGVLLLCFGVVGGLNNGRSE